MAQGDATFWGIALGALIASASWLYQKAWERHEQRIQKYQEILDRLPAFTTNSLSPEIMNKAIREHRRLWLFAPDHVVVAAEALLDIAEGKDPDPDQLALGRCVLAMRRDASFASTLIPGFWMTRLTPGVFRLRSANKIA